MESQMESKWVTPMMAQYLEIKAPMKTAHFLHK